jgi:hypothetical protein
MRPRDSTVGYSTRKGRGSARDKMVQPVSRLAPSRHPALAHGLLEIENRDLLVNRGTPRAAGRESHVCAPASLVRPLGPSAGSRSGRPSHGAGAWSPLLHRRCLSPRAASAAIVTERVDMKCRVNEVVVF